MGHVVHTQDKSKPTWGPFLDSKQESASFVLSLHGLPNANDTNKQLVGRMVPQHGCSFYGALRSMIHLKTEAS